MMWKVSRGRSQTGEADYYSHGNFNRICDRCGFKKKASNTRHEWNGLIVCHECYEDRHPQDFVRGRRDRQAVRHPRPENTDDFLTTNEVTTESL